MMTLMVNSSGYKYRGSMDYPHRRRLFRSACM